MKNVRTLEKVLWVIIILVVTLIVWFAVSGLNNKVDIPDVIAVETTAGAQAKALLLGYSWHNGKDGVVVDAIPTWQGEYANENTLIIEGETGQNVIALSVDKPMTASYAIYLPDGTVYDNGTREVYDSLSPRLYWTQDNAGINLIAPFQPGEYIYEVTVGWQDRDLKATYGIKMVLTGN